MKSRLMMSVAAVALIAGAGFANAQGTGAGHEAPAANSEHSAPAGGGAMNHPAGGAMNHDAAKPAAPGGMKSTQTEQKMPATNERAEENMQGQKSKSSEMNNNAKGDQDKKAEGREDRNGNMSAETKGGMENKSQTTTGQAAAGGKLSSEQRTRITTVIREQHIAPATNVNFSISVGTRIPHDFRFYPLPAEVVTYYPEWRGYEMFLVNDQIIIVDPRTFEIVAVIDA